MRSSSAGMTALALLCLCWSVNADESKTVGTAVRDVHDETASIEVTSNELTEGSPDSPPQDLDTLAEMTNDESTTTSTAGGSARSSTDELTSAEVAARDFSYQGVRIGTTLSDFTKLFPQATLLSSSTSLETAEYDARGNDNRSLRIKFFHGSIYSLKVTLSSDMLSDIGGTRVFETKLSETFGTPTSSSVWQFPNVGRALGYVKNDSGSIELCILDTVAHYELTAKREAIAEHEAITTRARTLNREAIHSPTPRYEGFTPSELDRVYRKLLRQGNSPEEAILTVRAMLDYPETKASMRRMLDNRVIP